MPLNFVAKAAITVGMMAANMALTMTRKIEGPRLDDTRFNSGDYGAPITLIWGKRRITPPIFWGEDLREVKRRRKTKGGKYNEYTYFGTWAVALADHEIAGISRIWFDTHLVFDLTGAGPVTPFDFGDRGIAKDPDGPLGIGYGGTNYGDAVALYLGTETQEPDPRMQATVEAQFGEGSCPAYRGVAYAVFKDIPLEKLGNRIPQVSVEVLGDVNAIYPSQNLPTAAYEPSQMLGATFSTDYSRFMLSDGDDYEIFDVAARARMIGSTLLVQTALTSRYGMYSSGSFLGISSSLNEMFLFSADGLGATSVITFAGGASHYQAEVRVLSDQNGTEHWMTIPYSNVQYFWMDGTEYRMDDLTGVLWTPYEYFLDDNGAIWTVGRPIGTSSTTAYFYRVIGGGDGPSFLSVTGLPPIGIAQGNVTGCFSAGAFILCWMRVVGDDCLYRIDPASGSILTSRTDLDLATITATRQFANLPAGSTSIWLDEREISLIDLTTIRTIDPSDWVSGGADGSIYDPINHALWSAQSLVQEINILFLDRIDGVGVPLSEICDDVAARCGVIDYDFSALTQVVDGWSVTQGDGANMIEPLLDAYDSDIRPHDFTVQGIKRTGVSGGSIVTEQFLKGEPRYLVPIKQADQLPRSITIGFADTTADQQVNNLHVGRPLDATDARGDQNIDLGTLALDPDDARALGERYFRRMWNGRKEPVNGLTAQYLALEPGDVRTLDLDGKTMITQLRKLTISANDSLKAEWRYDHPSLAALDAAVGATQDGRTPAEIAVPLISKGFVLDIPLLNDVDSNANPLLYVAAGPYASGSWPGAIIYEEVGGEYSDEFASVNATAAATWGYATDALGDANPWLWDRGNSVNVMLQVGALTGCTEIEIDADPTLNLCLLGNELLNFTTATLEGDGTYTLSGFKRGRRGTEWACADHVSNDVFLLLDTAAGVESGLSDVGTDLSFKAVTNGRTAGAAFPVLIAPFTGASLKPYAPSHLEAALDSGDWELSWVRRTRVGGAWTSGTTIPLSEASEEYTVRIYDGATLKRTVTGLTSPSYTYLAADQTADFGAPLTDPPEWTVVQVSDAVGDGFVAEYA